MHVLEVESVAVSAPCLVENLVPLLVIVHCSHHVVEIDGIGQVSLARSKGYNVKIILFHESGSLHVGRRNHLGPVGHEFILLFSEVEHAYAAAATVPQVIAIAHEVSVTSCADGHLNNAVGDAVDVNAGGIGVNLCFCFIAFAFLVLGSIGRGIIGLVTTSVHLVVLGQERRGGVLGQHHEVDAFHITIGKVPLDTAVDGVEITSRGKNQVLAVAAEGGRVAVIPTVGHRIFLALGNVVEVNHTIFVGSRTVIGQPLAVRRETGSGDLTHLVRQQGLLGLGLDVEQHHAVLAVGIDNLTTVGAPLKVTDVGVVVLGQLDGLITVNGTHPNLGLARLVADVGDILAVRTPLGIALVHTGSVGNVAGHTMLGGHIKYLATGTDGNTAAIGRQTAATQVVLDLALLLTSEVVLAVEIYRNLLAALGRRVKHIEVAAVLEHDLAATTVGKLHIILGKVSHLLRRARTGVIDKDVHAVIAVAHEIDFVANPHGIDILGNVVGHVGHRLGLSVIDPDVVGHAALVVFPGAELAEDAVIGQLSAIGIVTAKTAFGQRQLLRHTAIDGCTPQFAVKAFADAVTVNHTLAVGRPGHRDVVGAHAVAPIVTGITRREGDTLGFAALGWHDIDLGIAIILASKGDGTAVGAETGKSLIALV